MMLTTTWCNYDDVEEVRDYWSSVVGHLDEWLDWPDDCLIGTRNDWRVQFCRGRLLLDPAVELVGNGRLTTSAEL